MTIKPTLIMLVGLPASGKSTFAEQFAEKNNFDIVSSDKIRGMLYGDESIQGDSEEVFGTVHDEIFDNLYHGINTIYDACNIHKHHRIEFLNKVNEKVSECNKYCYHISTPLSVCFERNEKRDRKVPVSVISQMAVDFDKPIPQEGFDSVYNICNWKGEEE